MKRLIITGIPCTLQAWKTIFPNETDVEQKIISFIDIFEKYYYTNKKLTDLVPFLIKTIHEFQPDQVVLHDMSVSIGLLAIINAKKINNHHYPEIIIFNGAFSGFDVTKSPHPIRIQDMSYEEFEQEVKSNGGEVDPKYRKHYSAIKQLYQEVTLISKKQLAEKKEKLSIDLGSNILILASRDDPYIHFECLEDLEKIFVNSHLCVVDYGHFPYSGNITLIRREIERFQNATMKNVAIANMNKEK